MTMSRYVFVLLASAFATAITSAETPENGADSSRAGATLPGYSLTRSGDREDFDFLVGEWTTVQRRLIARGVGSHEWRDSPPNVHCATRYMNGAVTVEESVSPEKAVTGLFIYSFDMEKHQWALY